MDFEALKFILLLLFIVALIVGTPIAISYFIYRWLTKTKFKKYAFIPPMIIIGSVTFLIYTALYPLDSFYKEDFETYSGIKLPDSADILEKDASFPVFHPDYEAVAIVRLSESDYSRLKTELSKSPIFEKVTEKQKIGLTTTYHKVAKDIKESDIEIGYANTKKKWFRVAFLKDKRRVVFELSV